MTKIKVLDRTDLWVNTYIEPDEQTQERIYSVLSKFASGDAVLNGTDIVINDMEELIKYAEKYAIVAPDSDMAKMLHRRLNLAKIVAKAKAKGQELVQSAKRKVSELSSELKKAVKEKKQDVVYSAKRKASKLAYELKEVAKTAKRKIKAKLDIEARKNDAEAKQQGWSGWIDKQGNVHKIEKDGR